MAKKTPAGWASPSFLAQVLVGADQATLASGGFSLGFSEAQQCRAVVLFALLGILVEGWWKRRPSGGWAQPSLAPPKLKLGSWGGRTCQGGSFSTPLPTTVPSRARTGSAPWCCYWLHFRERTPLSRCHHSFLVWALVGDGLVPTMASLLTRFPGFQDPFPSLLTRVPGIMKSGTALCCHSG